MRRDPVDDVVDLDPLILAGLSFAPRAGVSWLTPSWTSLVETSSRAVEAQRRAHLVVHLVLRYEAELHQIPFQNDRSEETHEETGEALVGRVLDAFLGDLLDKLG